MFLSTIKIVFRYLHGIIRRMTRFFRRLFPRKVKSRLLEITRGGNKYQILSSGYAADDLFVRLRDYLFDELSEPGMFFKESGALSANQKYFYIKPKSQPGYLFERSGQGWVVSRCEKIVGRDLFLRRSKPVDSVQLYGRKVQRFPKVRSRFTKRELISFRIYEKLVANKITSSQ